MDNFVRLLKINKHLDTHRQRKRSSVTQKCLQEHLKQIFITNLSFPTNTETAAIHLEVQSNQNITINCQHRKAQYITNVYITRTPKLKWLHPAQVIEMGKYLP